MQPTALDITRQGDLGGHKVAMRFDENSIAHIMSVLTDLYSDPELAVIREYSTNGWDAHVEAGNPQPIEVTTPTDFSPFFKVKDYGLGLSVDDVENIYSQYGASTKRGTNEQTGMLGLGCKSALTYTSQFNIVAVKDGIKTTVAVARIEDGTGVMEIVDLDDTDEPNSVEIIVPTKRYNTFEEKARTFFSFWPEGTVLLNGKAPERISGSEIGTTGILLVDRLDGDYIVMGNVSYRVKDGIYKGERTYNNRFGLVAFVPIGSVNFTPSREALHYTTLTNNTIARLNNEFRAAIEATITADVANAASHAKAVAANVVWSERFPTITKAITYQGQVIPMVWDLGTDGAGNYNTYVSWQPSRYRNSVNKYERKSAYLSMVKALNITNFPSDGINPSQRAKVREYMTQQGVSYSHIYLYVGDIPGRPWTDEVPTVDWTVIKAIKLAGAGGRKSASGLRFSVVGDDGYLTDTDTLDDTMDIAYYSPADYSEKDGYDVSGAMSKLTDEVQVVRLSRNRWDKFCRDFPEAVQLGKWLNDYMDKTVTALTADDKLQMGLEQYEKANLIKLDETRVDDPELVKFIQAAKAKASDSPTRKAFEQANQIAYKACRIRRAVSSVKTPMDKYPLAPSGMGYKVHDHVYIYINAVFAEEISAETIDDESAA